LLILDRVHRGLPIDDPLRLRLSYLVESGVLERISRGRGVRYILSKRFYAMTGRKGVYTRKKGLDRGTNKALLIKHIIENDKQGSRFRDFREVLPSLSQDQLKSLIKELKSEERIFCTGKTRAGLWHVRRNKV
jgi:ATP-dependent DNA helicase RecG